MARLERAIYKFVSECPEAWLGMNAMSKQCRRRAILLLAKTHGSASFVASSACCKD